MSTMQHTLSSGEQTPFRKLRSSVVATSRPDMAAVQALDVLQAAAAGQSRGCLRALVSLDNIASCQAWRWREGCQVVTVCHW